MMLFFIRLTINWYQEDWRFLKISCFNVLPKQFVVLVIKFVFIGVQFFYNIILWQNSLFSRCISFRFNYFEYYCRWLTFKLKYSNCFFFFFEPGFVVCFFSSTMMTNLNLFSQLTTVRCKRPNFLNHVVWRWNLLGKLSFFDSVWVLCSFGFNNSQYNERVSPTIELF